MSKNERVVIPGALFCIPLQKMVFMDLNGILASVVAESGIEVLESDDLHLNNSVSEALYGYPAIASVLSKAVTSGSLRRMVASGIWDDATERLIDKFGGATTVLPRPGSVCIPLGGQGCRHRPRHRTGGCDTQTRRL